MKIILTSNIVMNLFKAKISKSLSDMQLEHEIMVDDLDQVIPFLAQQTRCDYAVIHLDADFFLPNGLLSSQSADIKTYFFQLLEVYLEQKIGHVILNLVAQPIDEISATNATSTRKFIADINREITDLARQNSHLSLIDLPNLFLRKGYENLYKRRNKFIYQMPYTRDAIIQISDLYTDLFRQLLLPRKKVCVLDADNTLWRGVIGEDGLAGIEINSEYPNIVYKIFQQQLLKLKQSGVLLCLCTKNNERDVTEFFEIKEMPLTLDDFIIIKSNWLPKSQNIEKIAQELNLSLSSFVFIDDNEFEINEVANFLPEVNGFQFDTNNLETNLNLLSSINGLYAQTLSAEDKVKTEQYQAEIGRSDERKKFSSIDDYIQSLDIELTIKRNDFDGVVRIAQLINKTNQFNLTTRRYTEAQIYEIMKLDDVYSVKLTDKYGDMGVIAAVIVIDQKIDAFLMSCRALGRKIERDILAYVLGQYTDRLSASYIKTAKNAQVKNLYDEFAVKIEKTTDIVTNYQLVTNIVPSGNIKII
jgi:FkbH-like protein